LKVLIITYYWPPSGVQRWLKFVKYLRDFNILADTKEQLFFIDEKVVENSIFYDHFYFYAYFLQGLERSKTVSLNVIEIIKKDVQTILKSFRKTHNSALELEKIQIEDATGLFPKYKTQFLGEFISSMKE